MEFYVIMENGRVSYSLEDAQKLAEKIYNKSFKWVEKEENNWYGLGIVTERHFCTIRKVSYV